MATVTLPGVRKPVQMDNMRHSGDSVTSDFNAVCNLIIVKTVDDHIMKSAGLPR